MFSKVAPPFSISASRQTSVFCFSAPLTLLSYSGSLPAAAAHNAAAKAATRKTLIVTSLPSEKTLQGARAAVRRNHGEQEKAAFLSGNSRYRRFLNRIALQPGLAHCVSNPAGCGSGQRCAPELIAAHCRQGAPRNPLRKHVRQNTEEPYHQAEAKGDTPGARA